MKYFTIVFALIIGTALFKLIDFENLKLENSGLAIVYLVALAFLAFAFIKNVKKKTKNNVK